MSTEQSGLLRDRNFLLLCGGNGISLMGTFGARLCYPILALEITGSPVLAGWVSFAATVPNLLFYAHAGAVADYSDRRRTMLLCQVLGALVAAVLTVWVIVSGPFLPVLLVTAPLLEGIFLAYFALSEVAAIRDLLPEAQYAAAFSYYEAEQPAAILTGRALGAAALGLARWVPFAGNLVSYAVATGCISAIRGDFSPVVIRPSRRGESRWNQI